MKAETSGARNARDFQTPWRKKDLTPVRLQWSRGETIDRNIEKSYRECKRYAYCMGGAWIDTNDTSSSGKNHTESHTGTGFEYIETSMQ